MTPEVKHRGIWFIIALIALPSLWGCSFDPEGTVTVYDPSRIYPGNTLFDVHNYIEPEVAYMNLLDPEGNKLWEYMDPQLGYCTEIVLTPQNKILFNPGKMVFLHILNPTTNKIEWSYSRLDIIHHDIDILPNGNIMFVYMYVYDPPFPMEYSPWDADGVRVIDPITKETVWDWKVHEYLSPTEYCPLCIDAKEYGSPAYDWTHTNAVVYRNEGGHDFVYMNIRNLNRILKVDMATKEIVWSMGDGGDFGEGLWSHCHDPEFLPNGNLLLFDNGYHRNQVEGPGYSRVIEIAFDPDAKQAEIVWEYRENPDFYTYAMGDADRLPNGNTLVTDACNGRVFEVTPDKEKVWEYKLRTPWNWIYKAERVSWEGP